MLTGLDILKVCASAGAFILATLAWVHWSKQQRVERSRKTSFSIACRILGLHAVTVGVLSVGFGCPVNLLAIPLVPFVLLLPVARFHFAPQGGALDAGVMMAVVLPIYAIKQFVLGFPDRDDVVLIPPSMSPGHQPAPATFSINDVEIPTRAVVVSPLKPYGIVEWQGERIACVSIEGTFVPEGETVAVCGRRMQTLEARVVRPADGASR